MTFDPEQKWLKAILLDIGYETIASAQERYVGDLLGNYSGLCERDIHKVSLIEFDHFLVGKREG